MENIIPLTIMDQKDIGDVLVQDIQSFIYLNPITLRVNFPNFKVDNLSDIVVRFMLDVVKCWNFIRLDQQNKIKEILMDNVNTYYQEHWNELLRWINEQIKNGDLL